MYLARRLGHDTQTRLFIPNLEVNLYSIAALSAFGAAQVIDTGYDRLFFNTDPADDSGTNDFFNVVDSVLSKLYVGLGVTEIETSQSYVMPLSKGIGSTGEVIHLLGAKNEQITLKFNTNDYPGRFGFLFRSIIQSLLEDAIVVYLIDDLFLATPCLLTDFTLKKTGVFRGSIEGELKLISLSTGYDGNVIEDAKALQTKISTLAKSVLANTSTGVLTLTLSFAAMALAYQIARGVYT